MIKAILVNSVFLNSSAKSSLALSSIIYPIETCEATIGSALHVLFHRVYICGGFYLFDLTNRLLPFRR